MDGEGGTWRGRTIEEIGTALAILHAQHDEVRDLLERVQRTSDVERQDAFDALRELLASHEAAEELVLRPAARRAGLRTVAAARDGEERQIAGMLAELERLDVDSREFDRIFARLAEALAMHTWLEETEEFPALQARWSEEKQERLGGWIRRALALGPTHAHPLASGSSVAQWTVGPFTALLDRARDRFEQAREPDGGGPPSVPRTTGGSRRDEDR
jgi:hypothetical protein